MTHRNNHPLTFRSMPTRMGEQPRVALAPIASYSFVVVVLITVLPGAGFGYV
jgi:hypothetical protein